MEQCTVTIISISIAALAAIGAVIAAIGSWKSASETRKTALAQTLMQITDAYSSSEMLEGMIRLRNWKNKHPKDFAQKFAEMRKDPSKYADIEDEDKARRRYSHHFYKIWLLFDSKLIDMEFVKKVATSGQVDFLLEIIEPLEAAINPHYDHSYFDFFRKIYPKENQREASPLF